MDPDGGVGSDAGSDVEAVLRQADQPTAIILTQPDGTLHRGLPKYFLEQLPPPTFNIRDEGLLEADHLDEASGLYSQHVRLFVIMLISQLLVELNFMIMYVHYRTYAILEERVYLEDQYSDTTLTLIFWSFFGVDALYMLFYYCVGFNAAHVARPSDFEWFGSIACAGVVMQVVVAFFNKFNIMIFACRLMCHMYSNFLADLLRSMKMGPVAVEEDQQG